MIYRLAVAFILSAVLIGTALGEVKEDLSYIYSMDQRVEGNGFFTSYKDIDVGDLILDSKGHGSGSYSYDAKLLNELDWRYDSAAVDYYGTSERKVVFNESVDYAYGPTRLMLGNSFRSGAFQSLGKEVTCIKNYWGGVSMNAHFDSLDTISKDISANLYWKAIESEDEPYEESDEFVGRAALNVDAAFTGRGHFGALVVNNDVNGVKDVREMVDEDYIGTFSVVKKMSYDFSYHMKAESDDWLPCCYGGWDTMNYRDRKGFGKSAKGVFDCTCFVPPKSVGA